MRRACVVTLIGKYDSIEIIGDSKCGILTNSLQCRLEFNCVKLTLVFPADFPH